MSIGDQRTLPYGRLDRMLHRLAFSSLEMQRALGEVENRLWAERANPDTVARPVFVTSLPRAGTTLMLDLLASLPEFATATYRHMPYVLAPLLWERLARGFRTRGRQVERAHGDGMAVSVDSPEAFEEVLWMAFWPKHFAGDAIRPWQRDAEMTGFERFLRSHMAKLVAGKPGAVRYLSKNNANIARLGLLERMFPDATIVVPFRDPHAQVASLMRQHRRFTELHAREPFARRYMEDLGHFEFGAALRPIAFGPPMPAPRPPSEPSFWLEYWCDAYDAVLSATGGATILVDHDALSAAPDTFLPVIADRLAVARPERLAAQAHKLRPALPAPALTAPSSLLRRVARVHDELKRRALRGRTTAAPARWPLTAQSAGRASATIDG